MHLNEAVNEVNEASNSELGFIKNREKGDLATLIGRELILEDAAVVTSKYYHNENVLFTVRGDNVHYFRICSGLVVEAMKKLMEGLATDGLDWDAVAVTINQVHSRQGRRYYILTAHIVENDERAAV